MWKLLKELDWSDALCFAGVLCALVGLSVISWPIGLIALGACLVGLGWKTA